MNTDDEGLEAAEWDEQRERSWLAEQADLITLEEGFDR